ncbi:hypothetical protein F511_35072 [Dorcoceras hygrometricum]|uniref:Uncharacterized protein n=1 Tax=Dorcoceras hygrometricum TaxID=472368 RepID=A0A2Z7C8K3_9LAMI|nr:hypothetical protein F511_35072 [Dorcoceras hygrometricum]
MSATTKHSSEGVGSVSGEAPPMLKSGSARERKREQYKLCAKVCKNECSGNSRAGGKASVNNPELRVCLLIALAFDDVGKADTAVLGPRVPRYRQSGPRPDTRLLRHPALEGVTRSARTNSPPRIGRNKFRRRGGGGGGL